MLRLLGGVRDMSIPSTTTDPASGTSNPAAMRNAVVLPHPLGPSSVTSSPAARSRSSPASAVLEPKRFCTPLNASVAIRAS
jgi:hypothetical protein